MSVERLPRAPNLFTVNVDEVERVKEVIEQFFGNVLDFLEYNPKARKYFTKIESMVLQGLDQQNRPFPTDDLITLLIVKDYIAASVLEKRDERNFVQVVSACYLTPEIVKDLKKDRRLLGTTNN